MYSLVSASVLALDLVKHPSGARVADTVDRVLALQPAEVRALADRARDDLDDQRSAVLDAARSAPQMSTLARGVSSVVRGPLHLGEADTVVAALSQTLLGDLDGLLEMLDRERDVPRPALDAVAAAWVGAGSGPAVLAAAEALRQPWVEALSPLPPPLPDDGYGGHTPDLRDVLDTVGWLDDRAWDRVERAHAAGRRTLRWSNAMHVACHAAHRSGRVVHAARAQLAAARALRLTGVSTTAAARGAAMAVTAAVQATCVLDLLDVETARTLLQPWQAGAGAL